MSDVVWRLILVGSVVLAAAAAAGAALLRQRLRTGAALSAPLDLSGTQGRVLLFSEASCRSCRAARAVLDGSGVEYREIRYESEPAVHRRVGVTVVPLIVVKASDGGMVGRIVGKPSPGRIERLLADAGIK